MTRKSKEKKAEVSSRITSENYSNFFYTFDLGCASALVSADFELVSLDKTNPKKVRFVFRREPGIENVVDEYWADRLEVKARTFFDNVKMLKNRIYSE